MKQETQLDCFRRIQALAQNGLAYSRDPFDLERFEELQSLAAEGVAVNPVASLCKRSPDRRLEN